MRSSETTCTSVMGIWRSSVPDAISPDYNMADVMGNRIDNDASNFAQVAIGRADFRFQLRLHATSS